MDHSHPMIAGSWCFQDPRLPVKIILLHLGIPQISISSILDMPLCPSDSQCVSKCHRIAPRDCLGADGIRDISRWIFRKPTKWCWIFSWDPRDNGEPPLAEYNPAPHKSWRAKRVGESSGFPPTSTELTSGHAERVRLSKSQRATGFSTQDTRRRGESCYSAAWSKAMSVSILSQSRHHKGIQPVLT